MKKTYLLLIFILIFFSGCSTFLQNEPYKDGQMPDPEIISQQNAGADSKTWQSASLNITKQGFNKLQKADYEAAIRLLERSISINPYDGPAYYYLGEAWSAKKNYKIALKFNRLAIQYLKTDDSWLNMALAQKKKLREISIKSKQ